MTIERFYIYSMCCVCCIFLVIVNGVFETFLPLSTPSPIYNTQHSSNLGVKTQRERPRCVFLWFGENQSRCFCSLNNQKRDIRWFNIRQHCARVKHILSSKNTREWGLQLALADIVCGIGPRHTQQLYSLSKTEHIMLMKKKVRSTQ